jgi:hypothetical protein
MVRTNRIVCALLAIMAPSSLRAQNHQNGNEAGFQWGQALWQSGLFLGVQHGFRMGTEDGSRAQLKGPFFRDWLRSVKSVRGWEDGDPFIVNYVGHPMMGAVSGYIAVQNDPAYRTQQFGRDPRYWKSRLRATAFSAAYSAQFELGPASEASIGNIPMNPAAAGVSDLVITPVLGASWQITEDALDRYVVQRIEGMTDNKWLLLLARGMLNPSRSFANMMRLKVPWYRDDRGGVTGP